MIGDPLVIAFVERRSEELEVETWCHMVVVEMSDGRVRVGIVVDINGIVFVDFAFGTGSRGDLVWEGEALELKDVFKCLVELSRCDSTGRCD